MTELQVSVAGGSDDFLDEFYGVIEWIELWRNMLEETPWLAPQVSYLKSPRDVAVFI